jgi:hypothetical protein
MKSIPACTDYTRDANGQVIVVAMCGVAPQQMLQGAPGAQLQPGCSTTPMQEPLWLSAAGIR